MNARLAGICCVCEPEASASGIDRALNSHTPFLFSSVYSPLCPVVSFIFIFFGFSQKFYRCRFYSTGDGLYREPDDERCRVSWLGRFRIETGKFGLQFFAN